MIDLEKIPKETFAEIVKLAIDCNELIDVSEAKLNTMEDGSKNIEFLYLNYNDLGFGLSLVLTDDAYVFTKNPSGVIYLVKNHIQIQNILSKYYTMD